MDKQRYHQERRRLDQFINAAMIRLRAAAVSADKDRMQRAAEDMAQSVDELLALVGGHELNSGQQLDCPDCGQVLDD